MNLTDAKIRALSPAPEGRRYDVWDALVPGLIVRVSASGHKTLMVKARFGNKPFPSRRAIGEHGRILIDVARNTAREWLAQVSSGKDPAEEAAREKAKAAAQRTHTFGAVAEEWLRRHVRGQRKAFDVEREVRRELMPLWAKRPIGDISRRDVISLIEDIKDRPAPYVAHTVFGHARGLFNWAINRGTYGIEASPCDRLRPAQLIGAKKPRLRVLNDDEVSALWWAGDRLGYPFGPMFRLILLTGVRKSEASEARWREFDLINRVWTIPAERFKSETTHLVPLSDEAVKLLHCLPRFRSGDYVFSTTFGKTPVGNFHKAKVKLDAAMLEWLRRNTEGFELNPFVIHDIRRTVRTRLSGLRVPEHVAEMVIGHARRGLARIYDQHRYIDEMREALETWSRRLGEIVGRQADARGGRPAPEKYLRSPEPVG